MKKADLKDNTETQEQALNTRSIEFAVYHIRWDPRCRLCKEAPETAQHIAAGCKRQAAMAYLVSHNQVACIVYIYCDTIYYIYREYMLEVPESDWITSPKVNENDRAMILLNIWIEMDGCG